MSGERKPGQVFTRRVAEESQNTADPKTREDQKPQEIRSDGTKKGKHQNSVFTYIAILFAVAFFLLLLSYFMQQRNTAQMIQGLQNSATAMENIDLLQRRNIELDKQVDTLTEKLNESETQVETLRDQVAGQEKEKELAKQQASALSQFWQLVKAYENGAYQTCRKIIAQMEESGLVPFLPETEGADAAGEFAKIQKAVKK